MSKEQQAVIQGLIVTVLVVGFLTILWAVYIHLFPKTMNWLKIIISFFNYSFGLYLGVLSASLRVKTTGINAPLYVMLIFFFLNILLRLILIAGSFSYWLIAIKFIYSTILLVLAFQHAKHLQNKRSVYTYSRLK